MVWGDGGGGMGMSCLGFRARGVEDAGWGCAGWGLGFTQGRGQGVGVGGGCEQPLGVSWVGHVACMYRV